MSSKVPTTVSDSTSAPASDARANEQRFQTLLEGLDAIVWEMDVSTWIFTYVSPRAEEMLGYPQERWYEPGFWSDHLVHPDDRGWAVPFCVTATEERRDHEFDYRAVAADGRVVWLRDVVRVVTDESGHARFLRGVMVDVTAEKEAEQALTERARFLELSSKVGAAVTEGGTLRQVLQHCAQAIVEHLDAAFARVWTLNAAEQVLELQASAGMYTHLDGAHSRVPVGKFKIGLIAEEREPHLTNDVLSDPRVGDKEWARREGMVAFAGYPILVEGRVLGVVAMFARQRLSGSVLDALRSVADRVGLIIDRRMTENELRYREEQLSEAQRISHLGSWEWSTSSDTIQWSDELYRIHGLLPQSEPLSYEAYLARVHPDDREQVRRAIDEVRRTGGTFDFEERIVRPDGEVRVLRSRGRAVVDSRGRTLRLLGTSQDVTDQKAALDREMQLAQERLARAESEIARQRIGAVLESITDAFFALDRDWRFTYVNSEAEKLLLRSKEELLRRSIWEEFPQALGTTFEQMYRKAVDEQQTVQFQEFYPPLDGWFEVRAFPSDRGLSVYFRNINEQKQAQEALRYQSELTRTIADNATAAMFMMDDQGRTTYMNPAAEAMIGYTLEEIRDIPLHDAIHHHHPDGRPFPMAECPIDRALPEDNSVRAHEDVFIRKDGTFFPVVCAASPIFDSEGTPMGTVVEVRDVTEERRAQERLAYGERRYRSLVEATAAIVWNTSGTGEFMPPQPDWRAFTGQEDEQMRGQGWLNAIHPDDRPRTLEAWTRALETRSTYEVEHRLCRHDGVYRYMSARAVPILDDDGAVVEWVGVHTDISEQKETEAERERLIDALDIERRRLQRVFNHAPAVVAMYSGPDHVVSLTNPTWEQVVGKRNVVGKPFREVFPELEGSGLYELLDQVYRSGESYVGNEVRIEFDRHGSGRLEPSYWNFVWQPLTDASGRVQEIFVHAVEVTDQVLARHEVEHKAEEMARLARALEISNRELDQFAYVASHDLKAPLRGIANLSIWIEEDLEGEMNPEVKEHLELLRGRVHRMEGLIDGILQYSRAGRVREKPEPVDVGALLTETLDLLAPPEHVQISVAPDMPHLTTERLPLQQVFMNLISNAIKYNPREDARVEVGVRDAGEFHEFWVADNGPGIAPEYHERIFGIFQTLEARDKVEGTGIGLSLVKKMVENRGGRISLESDEGAGATFRFLWPKESRADA